MKQNLADFEKEGEKRAEKTDERQLDKQVRRPIDRALQPRRKHPVPSSLPPAKGGGD